MNSDTLAAIRWGSRPFVRFVVPLIMGILLQAYLNVEFGLFVLIGLSAYLALYLIERPKHMMAAFKLRHLHAPLIGLILIGLGGMAADYHHRPDPRTHFTTDADITHLQAELVEAVSEKTKTYRTVLRVTDGRKEGQWQPASGNLLVYLEKDSLAADLEIGDRLLLIEGSRAVDGPKNPGEFDYRAYLSKKGIHHQQYVKSGQWSVVGHRWTIRRQAERCRQYFIDRLSRADLGPDEEGIATALLLGKKERLSDELMHAYADAGAMHVLAVSGLHVGILYTILGYLLIRLDRLERGYLIKSVSIIIMLWMYAFITGLSPSVVRACAMFSAILVGKAMKRQSNVYNNIASSAFILLLFEPYYIFQVGFQLSYLAVIGIIYMQPKLCALLHFDTKAARWAWEISCVSIAAQLATLPLTLYYFDQFPVYALLSNFIVIPAAAVILYLGISYLLVGWIPLLGELIAWLLGWALRIMNYSVSKIETLPSSVIEGIDISTGQTLLLYAAIISASIYLVHYRHRAAVIALSCLVLAIGIELVETYRFSRHDYLAVYDVRRHSAINLLSDDYNILLSDSTVTADQGLQEYSLRGNWNRHDAPSPVHHPTSCDRSAFSAHGGGLYTIGQTRLAHVDEQDDLMAVATPIPVDYLILSYYSGLRMDRLEEVYAPKTIILDGSIGAPKAKKLATHVPDSIRLHSVVIDGYFEERLMP